MAGIAPVYGSKTGFDEGSPELNGGDPRFVNINDPLGPDGIPFTADDGLRVRPDSRLIGLGYAGSTPGAYATMSGVTRPAPLQSFRAID